MISFVALEGEIVDPHEVSKPDGSISNAMKYALFVRFIR